jgi:1-acyl-sn-glycerol-3-phosphate acyltransferase
MSTAFRRTQPAPVKPEKRGVWVGLAMAVFYPGTAVLARTRYIGTERVPRTGGALLVLNHVSNLDPFYDAVFVRKLGRNPHTFAKHTLWTHPVIGRVMTGSGQIAVERGSMAAGRSLHTGREAIRRGQVVLTYPEGRITPDPEGWPMVSYPGVARLALDLAGGDAPVLPIARWGTQAILNDYDKTFRPLPRQTVTYRVGNPVDLAGYREGRATRSVLREVTDMLMCRVSGLLAEIRCAQAPDGFYPRPEA